MKSLAVAALVCVVAVGALPPADVSDRFERSFTLVTRAQWGAQPPRSISRVNGAVPNVVIHHTSIPGACSTRNACSQSMRSVQNTHQNTNGWADIGYNFAVGGDGAVYEGRGWGVVGAHATNWNANSVGIVFIGDFSNVRPPANQIAAAQILIATGVQQGRIAFNYRLFGHRQVGSTVCPGQALFNEIQTWNRFTARP